MHLKTTLDAGVDGVLELDLLDVRGGRVLRRLERRLEARDGRLLQGLGAGNLDGHLTLVGADQLEEVINDLLGDGETVVVRERVEEVAVSKSAHVPSHLVRTTLAREGREDLVLVLRRDGRVVKERAQLHRVRRAAAKHLVEALEVVSDLVERLLALGQRGDERRGRVAACG